jgi:ABC-type dipeptide/oligopeptide/nickel transport system permease subunit
MPQPPKCPATVNRIVETYLMAIDLVLVLGALSFLGIGLFFPPQSECELRIRNSRGRTASYITDWFGR